MECNKKQGAQGKQKSSERKGCMESKERRKRGKIKECKDSWLGREDEEDKERTKRKDGKDLMGPR